MTTTAANTALEMQQGMMTAKELVKKHMSDPTHKITEELLKKVIVGIFPTEKKTGK